MTEPSSESIDPLSSSIKRLTLLIVRVERSISTSMLAMILVIMGAQVFSHYVLKHPFSWSDELSRFSLIWMALLAASFVMAEGKHISVDLWSTRTNVANNNRLQMLSYVLVAGCCIVLLLGGLKFVYYVHPVGSPAMGIPKSFWYAAVSVSLLLMFFHSTAGLIYMLRTGKPLLIPSVAGDEVGLSSTEAPMQHGGEQTSRHENRGQ
ncbi:MAG: TRAP transporter small permease [Pirellulales bacterium]